MQITLATSASAPSGRPPGRPSLRCSPLFSASVRTSKPTLTCVTPPTPRTASATAVWKWFLIGQPGVVSDTVTSTTPASLTSMERTMPSSTMSRRSSGSMTTFSASRMVSFVGMPALWQRHCEGSPMDRVNIATAEFQFDAEDPEGFRAGLFRPGNELGAKITGMSVYELPPGEALCPYHYEYGEEEWLLVLEGTPTLRRPEGTARLEPWDVAFFPTG